MNRPVPALGAGAVSPLRDAPRAWLAPLLILLLALAVRAAAARGDLWLDEIWSWLAVRDRVHGIADVFLGIRHDNNHILNSLWIHALGLEVDGRWYRLPAVVTGSLAVLVAWLLMAPGGRVAQWLVALLMAPSFLLVNYASEARGYGVLMLCVLGSLWALECFDAASARGDAGRARTALATFWLAALLGVMAHASYGATLLSLALWFAVRLRRAPLSRATRWRRFALLFAVPMLFSAWLWAVTYLDATVGGGPLMSAWQAAAVACSLALGGPVDGTWVWPLAGVAMAALFTEAALAKRAGDDRALLWLVMLLVPAVPLAAGVHGQFIYPRFFLGEVLYLLLAPGAARRARLASRRRLAPGLLWRAGRDLARQPFRPCAAAARRPRSARRGGTIHVRPQPRAAHRGGERQRVSSWHHARLLHTSARARPEFSTVGRTAVAGAGAGVDPAAGRVTHVASGAGAARRRGPRLPARSVLSPCRPVGIQSRALPPPRGTRSVMRVRARAARSRTAAPAVAWRHHAPPVVPPTA